MAVAMGDPSQASPAADAGPPSRRAWQANLFRTAIDLGKYAAHGFGLWLFFLSFGFLWAYLAFALVMVGALAGLLIALVVLALGAGVINTLLARFLWFTMKQKWETYIVHGIFLAILLVLVDYGWLIVLSVAAGVASVGPDITPLLTAPSVVASFAVVGSLVNGYLGKRVAQVWAVSKPVKRSSFVTPPRAYVADNPDGLHRPRCGGAQLIVARDRSAYCIDCRRGIRKERFAGS